MQITKLSFLSTQAVGDNVFAVEEFLDIPIDQIFGTHRAREKALFNFIESDAVEKVSRDTWRIIKDITLDAANVTMRQGDYFRVRLDEEGDDSPIHFGLDATGVFVLSRAVFASLQTYRVLEPGVQESIRMQFTFGGNPVVDAKLTSKFASMDLVPVDASAGIYELKVYTAMAPSDDTISIEITGTSLGNNAYEAPVRITVREPILTVVPIDTDIAQKQSKTLSWQLLMEGVPAPVAIPVSAVPDALIAMHADFTLVDSANAIYELKAVAGDLPGDSEVMTTYDFGRGYIAAAVVDVTVAVAPGVFITPDTTILEANQTQLIRFYAKWTADNSPVTNAQYSTTDIRGPGLFNVENVLVAIDSAKGLYGYRVTTNHKGGPVAVRTNITSEGIPYPVFFDLTSKSTPVTATALNTLPAADTQWLEFRVQQARLGGVTPLVGVIAKQFTVTGVPVSSVQGAVEAVGQGVYRLKVVTNDRGGQINVSAVLTVDGEDYSVSFSTTAAALSEATVISTGQALIGETKQAVPLEIHFEGALYDLGTPSVRVTGTSLISHGTLRRVGVGKYEIQDVDVNGKGGILNISVTGKVQGFTQTLGTTVAVNPVSAVVATNVTHYRPTTQGPLKFTALRDGVALALTFSTATVTGGGAASFLPNVDVINANTGEYQIRNVVASAPAAQAPIGVSIPYKLRGYSYTLTFNTYTEAMPDMQVDTRGLIPAGDVKADYPLYFTVDGKVANLEDSNISGSGPAFVSMDQVKLEKQGEGVWAIVGLLPGPDRGQIVITGTVKIDGITYPLNVQIRSKDAAPTLDQASIAVLEPELYQVVTFTLSKKGNPIGDALLSNGTVTGDAIESFEGFALQNAATGTYRFNVVTNGKGGPVDVNVDITIDGDVYPTHFTTTAKPGKAWGLTSTSVLEPAVSGQQITFSVTNDGTAIVNPYLRALTVTGASVREADNNIIRNGSVNVTSYRTTGIRLGSPAGDVTLKVQASTNNVNWHDLSEDWAIPEAVIPTVTVGPMLPAVATSIMTVRVTRNGKPLVAPVFRNLVVSGDPVNSATLDWTKLNANGTYGTTIQTNDKGGTINFSIDVEDDGVVYHLTGTGQADIVRPWAATLVTPTPKPEVTSYIDFQSSYGGAPMAMTDVKVRLVGNCVVSPTAEVTPIYQDGTQQIYRLPGVLLNNDGGPITLEISGTVYDQAVSTVLQMNVVALPAMQIASVTAELPFHTTSDWIFEVNRGAANPSSFSSADVSNLVLKGQPVAGYTPTVVPMGNGRYKISVETNSLGGQVDLSFDVTIAGQTNSLSLSISAAVEPPVSAVSLNTLETDSIATNMDFQLFRGTVPCADPFVVKSIAMTGRSITSYPQTVLNVDVATGKYRIQVNTSAYSNPVTVTIEATVRGEDVTLTFQVQVKQGVLPTVSLSADNFIYNVLSSGTLAFRQGAAAISGVVIDSITGPLEDWTVSGTTLTGRPTAKGASTLTVNFTWKSATYSSDVTINPVNSIIVTPIGDPKLKAYVANTVNFPLVQEDGSAYPAATTFTVSAAPFTATALNKKADGTYEMNLTYAGELLPTNVVVTANNAGVIVKHVIAYSVWFNLEARFSGTALLDSTQVSNKMQFDVYETNQGNVKDVYTGVNLNSLDVDAPNPNDLVGFSTFEILPTTKYRGSFLISTQPVDLSDMTFQFFWVSPVGRQYTVKGKFRVQKPVSAQWGATNLKGGDPATIQFYLKSGNSVITDAVDAGTTITNATLKKAPYVVDAAAGLYAIDVQPNGSATTMSITLKVKQQMNNLTSTLAAQAFSVSPGAYAVVPTKTLARQLDPQNLDVQFTQGGIPMTGVTVNSVTFDGAIRSLGTVSVVSGTTYRWVADVSIDGATPHMVFNITVNGVGMILDVDYPISAPVEPELYFYDSATFVKGQQTRINWHLKIGSTIYSDRTKYTATVSDDPNVTTLQQAVYLDTSSAQYRMMALVVPKTAGTGVTMHMLVTYGGVQYNAKFVADVADAGIIVYDGTYNFEVGVPTVVNFHINAPAGVTLDPTAVPVLSTPPFPITSPIVASGGTYTMTVTPNAETTGILAMGTIVSGGVTYKLGTYTSFPARYRLDIRMAELGNASEISGVTVTTPRVRPYEAIAGTSLNWTMREPTATNLRVTASRPDVLNGAPAFANYATNLMYFTVATNSVDFAELTWLMDFVSPTTGFVYKDVPYKTIAHDTVTYEAVAPDAPYESGFRKKFFFKLKWTKTGNPVQNAIYGGAHRVTGATVEPTLNLEDAAQGLYSVYVTPFASGTTFTVAPCWTFQYGNSTYYGTDTTYTSSQVLSVNQYLYCGFNRTPITGAYDLDLFIKVTETSRLVQDGWAVTSIPGTTYMQTWSGNVLGDSDFMFRIPVKTIVYSTVSGVDTGRTMTLSVTFTKGSETITLPVTVTVQNVSAPLAAMGEVTTAGGEIVLTGTAGMNSYYSINSGIVQYAEIHSANGDYVGSITGVNTYSTNTQIRINVPPLPAMKRARLTVRLAGDLNTVYLFSGLFDVVPVNGTTIIGDN